MLKTVPLLVREVAPEEHQRDFAWETRSDMLAVSPAKPLKRGVKYTLTVQENFPGAEGPLGLKKPYELTFYTYPALKTLGATTAGCLPYAPSVKFSSPVRLKDLLAAATVTPAEAKGRLSEADEMALGAEHLPATSAEAEKPGAVQEAYFDTPLSFLKLAPGQSVTVRLAPGLQDIYGNRLGQEETFTFTNEGYCPAVDYQGGTGVLESYLPARLPIELVNTPQLETQAVALAKDTFIPFQRESAGYCSKKKSKTPLLMEIMRSACLKINPSKRILIWKNSPLPPKTALFSAKCACPVNGAKTATVGSARFPTLRIWALRSKLRRIIPYYG